MYIIVHKTPHTPPRTGPPPVPARLVWLHCTGPPAYLVGLGQAQDEEVGPGLGQQAHLCALVQVVKGLNKKN